MKDRCGRNIEYLRVSVTDKCNLKCIYCRPEQNKGNLGNLKSGKTSSIYYNKCNNDVEVCELVEIITLMTRIGVKKVRITGGEPLLRSDIYDIVGKISQIPKIEDLALTTNGMQLEEKALELKKRGLNRVNISLDSLKENKFRMITGGGELTKVIKGIYKAIEVGLYPIRINTVLINGVNQDEIKDFINLTKDTPIEVRFIELMPIGLFGEKNKHNIVYSKDILRQNTDLILYECKEAESHVKYYKIGGYKGKIGFISSMGNKFCKGCNRIRLTYDGKLKPCLGDNREYDILSIFRDNPDRLLSYIKDIIYNKPEGHIFMRGYNSNRDMSMIGG